MDAEAGLEMFHLNWELTKDQLRKKKGSRPKLQNKPSQVVFKTRIRWGHLHRLQLCLKLHRKEICPNHHRYPQLKVKCCLRHLHPRCQRLCNLHHKIKFNQQPYQTKTQLKRERKPWWMILNSLNSWKLTKWKCLYCSWGTKLEAQEAGMIQMTYWCGPQRLRLKTSKK